MDILFLKNIIYIVNTLLVFYIFDKEVFLKRKTSVLVSCIFLFTPVYSILFTDTLLPFSQEIQNFTIISLDILCFLILVAIIFQIHSKKRNN
ncbi:hypothetical protein OQH60_05070 [Campylobacter sp. MIT 21-1685]|uniref:hypothetical protein n=1 Tax=unclassified Campylobacter TaxID=2593542 RepID=UPI00224B3A2B|nr:MULTISPECIES: hypothetical protein [unclassified Campylobacter]MCX2683290.1 hypothetical protein [Campylobacter sp. MIT 21-1684]MCX2751517.1 hypothetical protein [Campylobacter sp. MIT 21-1682]MCX2807716.1 hypothetical protein [Campylobacter sp. MIT 21-1685]